MSQSTLAVIPDFDNQWDPSSLMKTTIRQYRKCPLVVVIAGCFFSSSLFFNSINLTYDQWLAPYEQSYAIVMPISYLGSVDALFQTSPTSGICVHFRQVQNAPIHVELECYCRLTYLGNPWQLAINSSLLLIRVISTPTPISIFIVTVTKLWIFKTGDAPENASGVRHCEKAEWRLHLHGAVCRRLLNKTLAIVIGLTSHLITILRIKSIFFFRRFMAWNAHLGNSR